MSLQRNGKSNKSSSFVDDVRGGSEFPSRDELVSQLAQLRLSLEGAYETLESIQPSSDPDVTRKVADMVDIINGLHECEFELMDMLAKESPNPSRGCDNPVEREKLIDGIENDANSAASQEDLSVFGAYAVSSSRPRPNELSKSEKSEPSEGMGSSDRGRNLEGVDFIKRLEEIQKVNEKLVDRCRRLGLVLSRTTGLEKNFASKSREGKDVTTTRELTQRSKTLTSFVHLQGRLANQLLGFSTEIDELKELMSQVNPIQRSAPDISLSKIENEEPLGRPYRFGLRGSSYGISALSPSTDEAGEEENVVKKPRSYLSLGLHDSSSETSAGDYPQYLRTLREPFNRDHGERESAFVPIQNTTHLGPTRDKSKGTANLTGSQPDINNDVKVPRATANPSLIRRARDGGNPYTPQSVINLGFDPLQERQGRSCSARASVLPTQQATNPLPNNLFRSNYSKSPPSMQTSSGMGSLNSRSMASLENGRGDGHYMSRIGSRNNDPEDNMTRGFSERPNMSSNNLNKSYRQPTRSSSFYSELDFRQQDVFPPVSWEDEGLHTSPPRPRTPPEYRRSVLSQIDAQQITEELNRVLRRNNGDDSMPHQQNWWSSSTELGQADRHVYDHPNFPRAKPHVPERTLADCYSQIMHLHIALQEVNQQIRNLNVSVSGNKTATRDALLQHRFDLHGATRCVRDVSDMISESMKRMEAQMGSQTRIIMDIESRLRRVEENQRITIQKYERDREREWQVPGRPDFMVSQDLSFQYTHGARDSMRERENGSSGSMLNNQMPPGTRANNYWDNFRSYSRQNMLSKSNANVPQQFSHEASPSSVENSRYTSSDQLNNAAPSASATTETAAETRRNGAGKNLWATSGFYENVSTSKKRNKEQKSQGSTLTTPKAETSGQSSSGVAELLLTQREAHPELDENNSAGMSSRYAALSQLSTPLSGFRGNHSDREPATFSRLTDLDLPLHPLASSSRKGDSSERSEDTDGAADFTPLTMHYGNRSAQRGASKDDQDKRMGYYDASISDQQSLSGQDEVSNNNTEMTLNNTGDSSNWGAHGIDTFAELETSDRNAPLRRERTDTSQAYIITSSPITVTSTSNHCDEMNIRCEESAANITEDSLDQNHSRGDESTTTTSNNITS